MTSICTFFKKIAVEYGVHEAIIYDTFWHLQNWVQDNIIEQGHSLETFQEPVCKQIDKVLWFKFSLKKLQQKLPFWTENQVRVVLKNMINKKMILTTKDLNDDKCDHTLWYSLNI